MIKIEKDISAIPISLRLPYNEFFSSRVPRSAQTTHTRRIEVINNNNYKDEKQFNERYKQEDTKTALKDIYHKKCAYCEQKVEQIHVEHYRPKNTYYWLAYSWDNLILACSTCNQNKGTHFEIQGSVAVFSNTTENILNIHKSSSEYNRIELPKMINPEVTDPSGRIEFQKDGLITSNDICFAYTIEKCKIDRKDLNDERRKILEVFRRDILAAFVDNKSVGDRQIEILSHIRKFIRDSQDLDSQFLAFRKFAILSGWLNDIVKEMN